MEGLEINEIRMSDLEETFRIDAEFYQRYLVDLDRRFATHNTPTISQQCKLIPGPFGSEFHVENYTENVRYRYVRGKDVKTFFLEEGDNVYIPEADFIRLSEFALREGDILLSVVGTLGNAAIVTVDNIPAIFSCKNTVLRSQGEDPYFLISYLNSSIGQNLLLRCARGTIQAGLNLSDIRALFVPSFSDGLKTTIAQCTRNSYIQLKNSRIFYTEAEQTLLHALGLEDWQPPEPLTYIRQASEAFAAGRLDAEHFQPKYDALIEAMHGCGLELVSLDDLILPVKNGVDLREFVDNGTPYIRVGDIKNCRIDLEGAQKIATHSAGIRKDIALRVGDVLFTRKGSFGNAASVREGEQHAIISSEIILIRRKPNREYDVLPVFLALCFNSIVGNYQAEKWAHGMAFYSIAQDDLNRFLVPMLPREEQLRLQKILHQAESASRDAHKLLEQAKRAVEIAIEQSETDALDYLNLTTLRPRL